MRKMILFMLTSLNGYFEGPNHDLSWHNVDKEFNKFAAEQLKESDMLIFGRRTYELMRDYWPNEKPGDTDDEIVIEKMNKLPKIVYSKSLQSVEELENWKNITLRHEVDVQELESLKKEGDGKLTVLGSSNLSVSLLKAGVLDEVRIMINPVVIGKGTPLFEGIDKKIKFTLTKQKTFQNGNVLLYYNIEK